MGVQHPNEEPEGTYIPSQRTVVERICLLESGHTWSFADGGVRQGSRRLLVGIQPRHLGDESGRSWKKGPTSWEDWKIWKIR